MIVCNYWNGGCDNCPFGKIGCGSQTDYYTKEDWIRELKDLIDNCNFVIDNMIKE